MTPWIEAIYLRLVWGHRCSTSLHSNHLTDDHFFVLLHCVLYQPHNYLYLYVKALHLFLRNAVFIFIYYSFLVPFCFKTYRLTLRDNYFAIEQKTQSGNIGQITSPCLAVEYSIVEN